MPRSKVGVGFVAALFIFLDATPAVWAENCGQSTIVSVADEGAIVKVAPNFLFQILAVDRIDSMLWLPGDDVLVCSSNFTYQGQQMVLYTLRDLNSSGDDPDGASAQLLN